MNLKKKLAIIDADSLVYQSSKNDLNESILILNEKINNLFEQTGADYYIMFISLGGYFRHNIAPEYKIGRKAHATHLLWIRTLKNYLIDKYNAIAGKGVEADDLCAYFINKKFYVGTPKYDINYVNDKNKILSEQISIDKNSLNAPEEIRTILCSPDKDLLYSIEGVHFNYSYKLLNKMDVESLEKGRWIHTTRKDKERFKMLQLLMGDPGDNIKGIPEIGKVKGNKIVDNFFKNNNNITIYSFVLNEYIKYYKNISTGIFEFQKNYRLLHLLDTDEDFFREIGSIPELPLAGKVHEDIYEIKNEF